MKADDWQSGKNLYLAEFVAPFGQTRQIVRNMRQYIKEKAEEMGMFIPGLEIKENPRTSKSYRLESLQPLFANKKVHIQKNMQAFIDELTLYPRGKHDDLLDGFFYANKNCYKPAHDSTEKKQENPWYMQKKAKSWKLL